MERHADEIDRAASIAEEHNQECYSLRTHVAYIRRLRIIVPVKAVFVELPAFDRHRDEYLSDEAFRMLQATLMKSPEAGDAIEGTGGLRKLRFADARRGKGKRSGLRVIYYWWQAGLQFWLYTVYDKDEQDDLSTQQRKTLKVLLKAELEARRKS